MGYLNKWEDKLFKDYGKIETARQKFEDDNLIDAFNILFLQLEDVMNGCYNIYGEHRHEKDFFSYLKIVNLLFEEEYINENTKDKLLKFKSTRVEVTHYSSPSAFGRRKHNLTSRRICADFEMGITLQEQIYQYGFDLFIDAYCDMMEEG